MRRLTATEAARRFPKCSTQLKAAARRSSVERAHVSLDSVADEDVAIAAVTAAELLVGVDAHTRRTGEPRGAHDLLIAATALARDRIVVTADPKGFEGLPGLAVRVAS